MAHKPDAKKTEANHTHLKGKARAHACQVKGCKAEYRAKGYCNTHYTLWRKGEFGKTRYQICTKEACRKPTSKEGLCETHWAEKRGKTAPVTAPAAAAPAAPAAPAA